MIRKARPKRQSPASLQFMLNENKGGMTKMTEKNIKPAMIAAVSAALKYKEKNPKATDQEIISYIVKNANEIIGNLE